MKLDGLKKYHFIGIGGVGMSALAKILIEQGCEISGSDAKDSATLDMLRKLGARIFVGHKAKNILDEKGNPVEAIVCSSAIPTDNPEVIAAGKFKIPKLHRSDINAYLLNSRKGIAVSGSHGKTTTTSMIGYVLHSAEVDPTIIIGGESTDLGTGAILGQSDWLVTEADESDGSFLRTTTLTITAQWINFALRSKFLSTTPTARRASPSFALTMKICASLQRILSAK